MKKLFRAKVFAGHRICCLMLLIFLNLGMTEAAHAIAITEFPIPTTASLPLNIVTGPDGNLWFTENAGHKIGQISPDGVVLNEFPTSAGVGGITAGPDGNLWFTLSNDRIGRITTAGVMTEFSAGITAASLLSNITPGPDGNLWFTEQVGNQIGRITPLGVVTEFPIPTAVSGPVGITLGPDGNLWFAERSVDKIGRITTAGVFTEFSVRAGSKPCNLTSGPDGHLWYVEQGVSGNGVGQMTTAGAFTEFFTGITTTYLSCSITTGPDGNLWFNESSLNKIARMTPAGVGTEFSAGITASSAPAGITLGPDSNLWFTEINGNRIARAIVFPLASFDAGSTNLTVDAPASGTTTVTFTVILSEASSETVTVDFATSDGTASAAAGNYVPASGTLTFNPNELSKTIDVTVNASDHTVLAGTVLTVNLTLSNPTLAVLGAPTVAVLNITEGAESGGCELGTRSNSPMPICSLVALLLVGLGTLALKRRAQ